MAQEENAYINTKCSNEVKNLLRTLATQNERTLSQEVRVAIDNHLKRNARRLKGARASDEKTAEAALPVNAE